MRERLATLKGVFREDFTGKLTSEKRLKVGDRATCVAIWGRGKNKYKGTEVGGVDLVYSHGYKKAREAGVG